MELYQGSKQYCMPVQRSRLNPIEETSETRGTVEDSSQIPNSDKITITNPNQSMMIPYIPSQYYPTPSVDFLSKFQIVVPPAISELAVSNQAAPLEGNFSPGEYDVVCGRGKGSYNRPGNKRFRALVTQYIDEYTKSRNKLDKTMVLATIIEKVRSQDYGRARFVKHDKKNGWFEISDDQAREKVGHAMREAIAAEAAASAVPLKRGFTGKHADLLSQQKELFQQMVVKSQPL